MNQDRRLLWILTALCLALLVDRLTEPRPAAAGEPPRLPKYEVVYVPREMIISDKLLHDAINEQAAAGLAYVDTIYGYRTDLNPPRSEARFIIYRR